MPINWCGAPLLQPHFHWAARYGQVRSGISSISILKVTQTNPYNFWAPFGCSSVKTRLTWPVGATDARQLSPIFMTVCFFLMECSWFCRTQTGQARTTQRTVPDCLGREEAGLWHHKGRADVVLQEETSPFKVFLLILGDYLPLSLQQISSVDCFKSPDIFIQKTF